MDDNNEDNENSMVVMEIAIGDGDDNNNDNIIDKDNTGNNGSRLNRNVVVGMKSVVSNENKNTKQNK